MDEETGKLTGMLSEYISYAKDCLNDQTLEFNMKSYDNYDEMTQALQEHEIDIIFIPAEILILQKKKDMHLQIQRGLTV